MMKKVRAMAPNVRELGDGSGSGSAMKKKAVSVFPQTGSAKKLPKKIKKKKPLTGMNLLNKYKNLVLTVKHMPTLVTQFINLLEKIGGVEKMPADARATFDRFQSEFCRMAGAVGDLGSAPEASKEKKVQQTPQGLSVWLYNAPETKRTPQEAKCHARIDFAMQLCKTCPDAAKKVCVNKAGRPVLVEGKVRAVLLASNADRAPYNTMPTKKESCQAWMINVEAMAKTAIGNIQASIATGAYGADGLNCKLFKPTNFP